MTNSSRRLFFVVISAAMIAPGFATGAPVIPTGTPIDENYRREFATCDNTNMFNGTTFPIVRNGKTIWYGCTTDPSKFERFEHTAAAGQSPAAVIIVSKLGHDEDGSWKACHHQGGPTDQCTTSLMLKPSRQHPCPPITGVGQYCWPVDPDAVSYVVIPFRSPPGIDPRKFMRLSGLGIGDYGVVIEGERLVPVLIADTGPGYKIGEGSTALLAGLSQDGKPRTVSRGVAFILFPGSRDSRASLSPDTLPQVVRQKGMALYRKLTHST